MTPEDAALGYAARGWAVFPLHSESLAGGCTCNKKNCSSPAKHPRTPNGLKDATTDPDIIRSWWGRWPEANVGVATGGPAGLVVLDVDPKHGGNESLGELQLRHGPLPDTLIIQTGGGGSHFYFTSEKPPRNTVNLDGLPGLDIRGEGGYVVAPPSNHSSGGTYSIKTDLPLAPLPEWLSRLLAAPTVAQPTPNNGESTLQEGGRNAGLTSLAGAMRRRGCLEESILLALKSENETRCKPPLPYSEVQQIARSVVRYGPAPEANGHDKSATIFEFLPKPLTEVLDKPEAPINWIVEGLIPEASLCILSSYPKVGKSSLAYALAVAVAQRREFIGYHSRLNQVLILSVEESERDVLRRLRYFGARATDYIHFWAEAFPNTDEAIAQLSDKIRKAPYGMVIIDTFNMFLGLKDENDNAEMIRKTSPLLHLAHQTGTCIFGLAHNRKSEGADGRGIRGASSLLGIVDHAFELDRRHGGSPSQRVIKYVGRYSEIPAELVIDLGPDGYSCVGTPIDLSREADTSKVLEALTATPMSEIDLIHALGISRTRVRRAIHSLGRDVTRSGSGVRNDQFMYSLSE